MTMTADEVLANGNTSMIYNYPAMTKTMRSKGGKQFKLHVAGGQFADSEILVLLGEFPPTNCVLIFLSFSFFGFSVSSFHFISCSVLVSE